MDDGFVQALKGAISKAIGSEHLDDMQMTAETLRDTLGELDLNTTVAELLHGVHAILKGAEE